MKTNFFIEIPVLRMRLFYIDCAVTSYGPTELRFPNQQLQLLHVDDGDEFFIQVKIFNKNLYKKKFFFSQK